MDRRSDGSCWGIAEGIQRALSRAKDRSRHDGVPMLVLHGTATGCFPLANDVLAQAVRAPPDGVAHAFLEEETDRCAHGCKGGEASGDHGIADKRLVATLAPAPSKRLVVVSGVGDRSPCAVAGALRAVARAACSAGKGVVYAVLLTSVHAPRVYEALHDLERNAVPGISPVVVHLAPPRAHDVAGACAWARDLAPYLVAHHVMPCARDVLVRAGVALGSPLGWPAFVAATLCATPLQATLQSVVTGASATNSSGEDVAEMLAGVRAKGACKPRLLRAAITVSMEALRRSEDEHDVQAVVRLEEASRAWGDVYTGWARAADALAATACAMGEDALCPEDCLARFCDGGAAGGRRNPQAYHPCGQVRAGTLIAQAALSPNTPGTRHASGEAVPAGGTMARAEALVGAGGAGPAWAHACDPDARRYTMARAGALGAAALENIDAIARWQDGVGVAADIADTAWRDPVGVCEEVATLLVVRGLACASEHGRVCGDGGQRRLAGAMRSQGLRAQHRRGRRTWNGDGAVRTHTANAGFLARVDQAYAAAQGTAGGKECVAAEDAVMLGRVIASVLAQCTAPLGKRERRAGAFGKCIVATAQNKPGDSAWRRAVEECLALADALGVARGITGSNKAAMARVRESVARRSLGGPRAPAPLVSAASRYDPQAHAVGRLVAAADGVPITPELRKAWKRVVYLLGASAESL